MTLEFSVPNQHDTTAVSAGAPLPDCHLKVVTAAPRRRASCAATGTFTLVSPQTRRPPMWPRGLTLRVAASFRKGLSLLSQMRPEVRSRFPQADICHHWGLWISQHIWGVYCGRIIVRKHVSAKLPSSSPGHYPRATSAQAPARLRTPGDLLTAPCPVGTMTLEFSVPSQHDTTLCLPGHHSQTAS